MEINRNLCKSFKYHFFLCIS